jgi:tellurite resistance protein TehA-like permease
MALATIINMIVFAGKHPGFVWLAWGLWWLDVALTLFTCTLVTYYMISRHEHHIEQMSSLVLLPVVSAPVCSTSAAVLIPELPTEEAYITLIGGYALWGFGVCMASMILTLYLQRLILHHLPPKNMTVSIWLPIGYLGQVKNSTLQQITNIREFTV